MAVSSGVGYWAVYYCQNTLGAIIQLATTGIGLSTVFSSFTGTICAGKLLDYWGYKKGGKSCTMAYIICAICSFFNYTLWLCYYLY